MKAHENIKKNEGLVVGTILVIITLTLIALSFMFPNSAEAQFGQAGTNRVCLDCHSSAGTGTVDVAVNGVVTTSATITNDGVDSFEVDYRFFGMGSNKDSVGVLIAVPTGWTVESGTLNSPAISGWSTAWDNSDGAGQTWRFQIDNNTSCPANHECYVIEYAAPWSHDGGPENTACDVAACGTGTDQDGVADDMGTDFIVKTSVGAPTGAETIHVYGIGFNGNSRRYVEQIINVTVSAGANSPPTLTVTQPDGVSDTVTVGAAYNVTYDLADSDNVVTAAFYYDTDALGLDGTAISGACATAAEGTGATCSWDTTGVTPGTYYVYGITDDGVNPAVNDYSSGQITIDPAPNNPPTLTVNDPDGVSDNLTQGNVYNINYDLADTEETVTVAFYYDTDNTGLDGTAISGACAAAPEGTGATCGWDTTGVPVASYYIYGITDDGVNPAVNDYSPGQVTINAPNTAPTLSIAQPDGVGDTVTEGTSFNITYTMTDPDDIATVSFYYDVNNTGADGTAIAECANQAEGTGVTCAWNTAGEAGTWYVYGIADDGVNAPVTTYSSGTITINDPPTLTVNQPDGVSDTVTVGNAYNINYDLADGTDVVTAAFYYDTDNTGLDGTAITGACATAAEGTGATCSWDTTGMTPGSYYVYGITNDGLNPQVDAYSSGQITINSVPNNAPDAISQPSFSQEEEISTNPVAQGRYANENSIVFRATVEDTTDGHQVQLEIEIVDVDASFTNSPSGGCTAGPLVNSGSQAYNTCNVANGAYKWQGRAIDELGLPGPWTEY